MATELFADNAATTLTSSPIAGATSFTVASSTPFPAAATGVSQFRVIIGTEIVTVTNVSGTTWTCNALAAGHTSGDAVTAIVTSAALGNLGVGGGDYFRSGYYALGMPFTGTPQTLAMTLSRQYFIPYFVPVRRAFDRIGINVLTAGTSNAVRLGIYANAGGTPGVLLLDAGTVSSTTTGLKEATISLTLDPGWYWMSCAAQGGTAPNITFYPTGTVSPATSASTGVPAATSIGYPIVVTGVTGAFANPAAPDNTASGCPLVLPRAT